MKHPKMNLHETRMPTQPVKFGVMTSHPMSCLQPTVIMALGLASLMKTALIVEY